jgi:acyl-CoA synthetase (AMP-forming)/AMP-acid ligase II
VKWFSKFSNESALYRSIPEMGYDACASPPEGEVCLRGPAVFLGYHKRPDLTEKDKCALSRFSSSLIFMPVRLSS